MEKKYEEKKMLNNLPMFSFLKSEKFALGSFQSC